MTAPATGTAPAAPGSTEPPVAPQAPEPPAAAPATGPADGDLGDAGKAAIKKERDARQAAEKAQKALEARVKEFEDAQKTEGERTAERIAKLEVDAAKALRYEAAAQSGLPLSLAQRLNGTTLDELVADAEQLKQLVGSGTSAAPATPKPDPRQGGGQADTGGTMAAGRAAYEAKKNRT
ncbi:hypothetical protein [Nocardia sp. NPDC057440]|uniref:hypothetical protein n=1 Tax=Nocardia sp. NPDC057440 TaxID=3346134 RepID=UPI00367359A7